MTDHRCREHRVVVGVFATYRLEVCQQCASEFVVYYAPENLPVDIGAETRRLQAAGRLAEKRPSLGSQAGAWEPAQAAQPAQPAGAREAAAWEPSEEATAKNRRWVEPHQHPPAGTDHGMDMPPTDLTDHVLSSEHPRPGPACKCKPKPRAEDIEDSTA